MSEAGNPIDKEKGRMADEEGDLPRDAKIVKDLLKSMGVYEYEPRVVRQFLELWHQYVADVLTDAQVYSEHAGKAAIDCDDIKLAIQAKVNFGFSQPPPREVLMALAQIRNKVPLPEALPGPGFTTLPPEQDTLINTNYQMALTKKQTSEAVEETEDQEETADPNSNPPQAQETEFSGGMPQRVSFALGARRPG